MLGRKGLITTEYPDYGVAIVRYHKSDNLWKVKTHGSCDRDDPFVSSHRSIIYNLHSKKPIAISPFRRCQDDTIKINEITLDEWNSTLYEDGTMINVFWNNNIDPSTSINSPFGWTISSRSKLHALCRFTSDTLFKDMFNDALNDSGINIDWLNKDFCYTFILHHNNNRHISPIRFGNSLCLVSMTSITEETSTDGNLKFFVSFLNHKNIRDETERLNSLIGEYTTADFVETSCKYKGIFSPISVPAKTNEELHERLRYALKGEKEFENCLGGIVLTSKTEPWKRIRILSPSYEECVKLRGNRANLIVNYIDLILKDPSGDLIQKYAEYYPEEVEQINKTGEKMREIIAGMIDNYMDNHVRKVKTHDDLPHWVRRPVWDLHGIYLKNRATIRKDIVLKYLSGLSPSIIYGFMKNRDKELRRTPQIHLGEETPFPSLKQQDLKEESMTEE
jgi:hypothetical protein